MKLFIDSADHKKIAELAQYNVIDGVTINPTLLKVQQESPIKIVQELVTILPDAEINLQVTDPEPSKVYDQACQIAQLAENMVVKIPCNKQYMPVIAKLIGDGIPVNATLVFSASQALQLAKMGVNYISLFVGRLYDVGVDGFEIAAAIQQMLDTYDYDSELLVASVRKKEDVDAALAIHADAITIPPAIFAQLIEHKLSDEGLEKFKLDWTQGPHGQLLE